VVSPAAPPPVVVSAGRAVEPLPSPEKRRQARAHSAPLLAAPPTDLDDWLPPAYDDPLPPAHAVRAAVAEVGPAVAEPSPPLALELEAENGGQANDRSDVEYLLERHAARRTQERLRLEKTLVLVAGGLAVLLVALGLLVWL
jgi:hypothetical protein